MASILTASKSRYNSKRSKRRRGGVTTTTTTAAAAASSMQQINGLPRRRTHALLMRPPGSVPRIPPFPGPAFLTGAVVVLPPQSQQQQQPQIPNPPPPMTPPPIRTPVPVVPQPPPPPPPPPLQHHHHLPTSSPPSSPEPDSPPHRTPPTMVYKQISDSCGYRLMVLMPVGHREDGTYGILTDGIRPNQEYRLSTYYVNNVTYYNVPPEMQEQCQSF